MSGLTLALWMVFFGGARAQSPEAPLDTQPLEASRVDVLASEAAPAAPARPKGASFFSFDPHARGRGVVVTPTDMVLACAGAGALRDAALVCPLDHQVALRGLPGLLESCAAIGRGGTMPTTGIPVPHASTIRAAADARAAKTARLMPDCAYTLSAVRDGPQLQVAVPAVSGVVEVRVGWRKQVRRPVPEAAQPPVVWLQPVYQSTIPTSPEMVSVTIDLGAIRPRRGIWSVELAVEVLDAAGAATRVVVPVDVAVAGPRGPVELGPSLEVAVGTGSGDHRLADLPIPPQPSARATATRGLPGIDRTPPAGGGADVDALGRVLKACLRAPNGLTATTCRRLTGSGTRPQWPPQGAGPIVAAAARDDLIGLLRRMGEGILQEQALLPADRRLWVAEDAGLVVAALGGTLETMVQGADPITAMGAWAQQRPPTLPTGERFGFFLSDSHRAAPVASALYMTSLLAASTADPVEGPSQAGVGLLTLAANLSWTDNLPGGVRAPWSGMVHPKLGVADLGWLTTVARTADAARADLAQRWNAVRRSGSEAAATLGALHRQLMAALLTAATGIPDQVGEAREVRAERAALLHRLLGQLPSIYVRLVGNDLAAASDSALGLMDDPGLRAALPPIRRADLATIGALAALSQERADGSPDGDGAAGIVGVVGLGAGSKLADGGASGVFAPTAALAWQHPILRGRGTWVGRLVMVDAAAPFAWSADSGPDVDWLAVCSPGLQAAWAPTQRSLAITLGARVVPVAPSDDGTSMGLRLGVGVSRAISLER